MSEKKRILIVEDESVVAFDIRTILTETGYEVVDIVATGSDAIDKARALKPDLILMDIVLKGDTDGITAAQAIRDQLDIPVIYATAYADEQRIERATLTEPFGYLIKPFNHHELISNIEMALYKHQTEQKLKVALDESERLNKILLEREFRIKELREENSRLKERLSKAAENLR